MGCGMSTEEKEGKQRNEEIENQLKRDKMMQRNEIKMLLLGELSLLPAQVHEVTSVSCLTKAAQVPASRGNQPS